MRTRRAVRLTVNVAATKIGTGPIEMAKAAGRQLAEVLLRKLIAAGAALIRKAVVGTAAEAADFCFKSYRDTIERIRSGGVKVSRHSLAIAIAKYIGAEDENAKVKARAAARADEYRRITGGRDLVADEREQTLREKRAKLRT